MSRTFTKDTSNYMRIGVDKFNPLLAGAGAVSVHAWVYANSFNTAAYNNRVFQVFQDSTLAGIILSVHDGSSAVLRLAGRSTAADSLQVKNGTTVLSTGQWYSVGGVLNIGGDSITPYLNGASEGGGSVTFASATVVNEVPTGNDAIGGDGVPTSAAIAWDGLIARLAVWKSDIGSGNFASLAAGTAATSIDASNLVAYFPLVGDTSPEPDTVGSLSGTITGTLAQGADPSFGSVPTVAANLYRQMRG